MENNKMIRDNKRLAKGRRWFEYHCYEGEDSGDAELWHHTHQQVIILNREKSDLGEPRLYRAKFHDGFEYTVFNDELVKSPDEFLRRPYIILKPTSNICHNCMWYQLLKWDDCKTKIPSCEFIDGEPKKISTLRACPEKIKKEN